MEMKSWIEVGEGRDERTKDEEWRVQRKEGGVPRMNPI